MRIRSWQQRWLGAKEGHRDFLSFLENFGHFDANNCASGAEACKKNKKW
jgi:hypothetical protein